MSELQNPETEQPEESRALSRLPNWCPVGHRVDGGCASSGLARHDGPPAPSLADAPPLAMTGSRQLTIGLSLSLTGEYAAMGRQAEAALKLFVADRNAGGGVRVGRQHCQLALECRDDGSDPARCAEIYRCLCFEHRPGLLLGPYSSRLTRAAAPIAESAGMVLINHGGAGDNLYDQQQRLLVGVLTPAREYFAGLARLLSTLKFWRKRVALSSSTTPFGRAVIEGFRTACRARPAYRRGVRIRLEHLSRATTPAVVELLPRLGRARVNVLVSAGSFEHDVAIVQAVVASELNIPVLACVAAGVRDFRARLGDLCEGVIGPSQWEEQVDSRPEVGPTPAEFVRRMRAADPGAACDYPAAQAYAAGLLAAAAVEACGTLDQVRLREAFGELRTTTFYGNFALDRISGRQIGHQVLLVQWHAGQKVIIDPGAHAEQGALELPGGWRLILASMRSLRLISPAKSDDDEV